MRRGFLRLLIFPFLLSAPFSLFADAYEDFFNDYIKKALESSEVTGLTLAVVHEDKVFLNGYGLADIEKKSPVDPRKTLFRIGSVTKVFTALALMREDDLGRIDLEKPVNSLLPDLKIDDHLGPVFPSTLLTHTGGFDESLRNLAIPADATIPPLPDVLRRGFPRQIWKPGLYYSYSNYSYTLAGYLVEQSSKTAYETYIKQNILTPIEMTSTTFDQKETADTATGYIYSGSSPVRMPYVKISIPPAGALASTALDMSRFIRALLSPAQAPLVNIISERQFRKMTARHYSAHEEMAGTTYGFYEKIRHARRGLQHGGDWPGFSSLLLLLPEEKTGFFISYTGSKSPLFRDKLADAFIDRFFPSEAPRLPLVHMDLERFTGKYRMSRYEHAGVLKISGLPQEGGIAAENGNLVMSFPFKLHDPVTLHPVGGNLFVNEEEDLKLFFHEENGHITGFSTFFMVPLYLEKISFFDSMAFWLTGSAVSSFLLLSGMLFLPLRALIRKIRHRRNPQIVFAEESGPEKRAQKYLTWSSALLWLYNIAVGVLFSVFQMQLMGSFPLPLRIVLWIPVLNLIFFLATAFRFRDVFTSLWGVVRKIHYTLTTAAGFFMLLFYYSWHLFGSFVPAA